MSQMRHKTLRKLNPAIPVTTDTEKVRMLRALYIMIFNAEESLIPLTTELFHVMGEILEGSAAEQLDLNRIDKQKFLRELAEIN